MAGFSPLHKGSVNLEGAAVQFDPAFEFGIKVSKEKAAVYLGVPSKGQQDEWLNSVINGGAVYREAFNLATEDVQSTYELKDYDMQGNEVPIDKYKVLLAINVSSNCGLTPINYPALFVKKYNAKFPFFEKSDVNGAHARPVFTYLKAKLPTTFGNFVKWNFTKFLVDRNGQPFKRFLPYELSTSFEDDIKALLAQKKGEPAPPVDAK